MSLPRHTSTGTKPFLIARLRGEEPPLQAKKAIEAPQKRIRKVQLHSDNSGSSKSDSDDKSLLRRPRHDVIVIDSGESDSSSKSSECAIA